jgi:hypothetical protein
MPASFVPFVALWSVMAAVVLAIRTLDVNP